MRNDEYAMRQGLYAAHGELQSPALCPRLRPLSGVSGVGKLKQERFVLNIPREGNRAPALRTVAIASGTAQLVFFRDTLIIFVGTPNHVLKRPF
jgi:hypothetical protein